MKNMSWIIRQEAGKTSQHTALVPLIIKMIMMWIFTVVLLLLLLCLLRDSLQLLTSRLCHLGSQTHTLHQNFTQTSWLACMSAHRVMEYVNNLPPYMVLPITNATATAVRHNFHFCIHPASLDFRAFSQRKISKLPSNYCCKICLICWNIKNWPLFILVSPITKKLQFLSSILLRLLAYTTKVKRGRLKVVLLGLAVVQLKPITAAIANWAQALNSDTSSNSGAFYSNIKNNKSCSPPCTAAHKTSPNGPQSK